jgi:hypothetical protein
MIYDYTCSEGHKTRRHTALTQTVCDTCDRPAAIMWPEPRDTEPSIQAHTMVQVIMQEIGARLLRLPDRTAEAVIGGIEARLRVLELHAGDARGSEAWCQQTPGEQIDHAREHILNAMRRDEDGLSEASHAGCRLDFLMALKPELRQ